MNLNEIESALLEAKSMYDSGQITPDEYTNLLKGFEIENVVTANAEELQKKEELNTIINAAIKVASVLG